jgi:tetratricopeptide (TPR) repeat protein
LSGKDHAKEKKAASVKIHNAGIRNLLLTGLALAVITVAVFSPVSKNQFINWDDNYHVFENPQLARPLSKSVPYFFSGKFFIGNYIPLTMTVFALEYKAAGLEPGFYHKINLLIHVFNAILVLLFIYLLSNRNLVVSAFVALFFSIHPFHVESVAWVSELKDVLYSFFFLGGLIIYLLYPDTEGTNKWKFLLLTFLLFILSLLSKPAAIVFPLVLLLIDFYRSGKISLRQVAEKIPFLALSVVFGIIALRAQDADMLLLNEHTMLHRLLFASHSLLAYFFGLVLPVEQSIFYPYPQLNNGELPSEFYFAPFIVIALLVAMVISLKKSRLIFFGAMFFFINLVLVLQLVSIGFAIRADRYTYIPYIGLLFSLGMLTWDYAERKPKMKNGIAVTVLFVALIFAFGSYQRCKVWKYDDTMATDLLEKFPDDKIALNNKGFIMHNLQKEPEAIELYRKALAKKPDYAMCSINLSQSYMNLQNGVAAIGVIDTAIMRSPRDYNLLNQRAGILFDMGYFPDALAAYKKSIQVNRNIPSTYMKTAETFYKLNFLDSAIAYLDLALKIEPGNFQALNSKGYVLYLQGKYQQALDCLSASLDVYPKYRVAQENVNNVRYAIQKGLKVPPRYGVSDK